MRFLLVDRIIDWHSEGLIKGVKNIAMSEDCLEYHFPKAPVMPGVLLLESMIQLAGWLEAWSSGFERWMLVHKIRKCSFYGFALPGDQVALDVRRLPSAEPPARTYRGIGEVGGKRMIRAEFEGEMIALSGLEDIAEQRHFFEILTREFRLR
jgi:3-hydroxyacyl-[acyl-carrier-protein] dehydratase